MRKAASVVSNSGGSVRMVKDPTPIRKDPKSARANHGFGRDILNSVPPSTRLSTVKSPSWARMML